MDFEIHTKTYMRTSFTQHHTTQHLHYSRSGKLISLFAQGLFLLLCGGGGGGGMVQCGVLIGPNSRQWWRLDGHILFINLKLLCVWCSIDFYIKILCMYSVDNYRMQTCHRKLKTDCTFLHKKVIPGRMIMSNEWDLIVEPKISKKTLQWIHNPSSPYLFLNWYIHDNIQIQK